MDMDIGFALCAIAKNAQRRRVLKQAAQKIETDTVCLPRADHISEAEDSGRQPKHVAVGTSQGLTGQLAGGISRDRDQRTVIFSCFELPEIALNPATRSVEDIFRPGKAHGFEDMIREAGPLTEIDIGIG